MEAVRAKKAEEQRLKDRLLNRTPAAAHDSLAGHGPAGHGPAGHCDTSPGHDADRGEAVRRMVPSPSAPNRLSSLDRAGSTSLLSPGAPNSHPASGSTPMQRKSSLAEAMAAAVAGGGGGGAGSSGSVAAVAANQARLRQIEDSVVDDAVSGLLSALVDEIQLEYLLGEDSGSDGDA